MCDLESVSALIAAAEVAALVVLAALAFAVILRGSIWTAFASTVPMVAALIAIALAISSLSAAAVLLNKCLGGACNTQVRALQLGIQGLVTAFTIIGVAIGIGMIFAIPWVGAAAVLAIIVAMLGASLVFGMIGSDLTSVAACERMASSLTSSAATGGFVVGAVLSIGLIGLFGYSAFGPNEPR